MDERPLSERFPEELDDDDMRILAKEWEIIEGDVKVESTPVVRPDPVGTTVGSVFEGDTWEFPLPDGTTSGSPPVYKCSTPWKVDYIPKKVTFLTKVGGYVAVYEKTDGMWKKSRLG
jgi:hypothetical protein